MNSLVLYGAGGHAKVIYDIILSNDMLLEYLVDDNPPADFFHHLEIYKPTEDLLRKHNVIVAIGDANAREKIVNKLSGICDFETLIHRSAFVSRFSELGEGTVVMPQVCVNAEVKIGNHCIINTASVIEHDCVIEDFVHISPTVTLAGNITIKKMGTDRNWSKNYPKGNHRSRCDCGSWRSSHKRCSCWCHSSRKPR
ncbi:MAG: acetyltransferase [Cloacibacterium sp.]|nr:acetyltransferase [Cloacibacterium sp.]